ncbi:protein Wnt-7b-like [Tubulanus polymorphus]|uniref:protein Wnt-7b-like n=1 Tax=Tubulanus polymorphus TaxID=672921 RepID=UPI003DA60147
MDWSRLILLTSSLLVVICSFLGNCLGSPSAAALGARLICNKIPGMTHKQRAICQNHPDALVAIGRGAKSAIIECQNQFKGHRWNCTIKEDDWMFGHILPLASREAAFTNAISSAGITYAITQACSMGNLSHCGCDRSKMEGRLSPNSEWKWGGCSVDIKQGIKFSKWFVDARERNGDPRALMNLHNNCAGRQAVKKTMRRDCKCHGPSGSCSIKTCWLSLPSFRKIGSHLMDRYWNAKEVEPHVNKKRPHKPLTLKLKRVVKVPKKQRRRRRPRRTDLVYLESSPNYCERDMSVLSPGTRGRQCNRSSNNKMNSCHLLCCDRGYNTHQYTRTWQCNCKFIWCCDVTCQICRQETEIYTCK